MGASTSFAGKHAVITGGSEGIGYALAARFVAAGAHVTIVSRTDSKLKAAQEQLSAQSADGNVHTEVADVSDFAQVEAALQRSCEAVAPIDVLVCNAGHIVPEGFHTACVSRALSSLARDCQWQCQRMQVNFFGAYNAVKAALPSMLQHGTGHICLVSSAVLMAPMVGFTAYAPAKAAVRALVDCLRSELLGTGVNVSIAYPPDTATPGYEAEQVSKPPATEAVSRAMADSVYSAEQVAAAMFAGLQRRRYHLPGPDALQNLGLSLIAGAAPRPQWLLVECLLAPLLVIIAAVTRMLQDRAVKRTQEQAHTSPAR